MINERLGNEQFSNRQEVTIPHKDFHGKVLEEYKITIENLQPFDEVFPVTEVITRETPYIKEFLPTTVNKDELKAEDKIWLTPGMIEDRLDTLFHTNSAYNVQTHAAVRDTKESKNDDFKYSEVADRIPLSVQELVSRLQHDGLPFVTMPDGVVGVSFDASIPAAENFDWKIAGNIGVSMGNAEGMTREVNKPVQIDSLIHGFLPAKKDSYAAIVIPLEEIIKIYLEKWGLSKTIIPPGKHIDRLSLVPHIERFFYYLSQQPEYGEKIDAILSSRDEGEKKEKNI